MKQLPKFIWDKDLLEDWIPKVDILETKDQFLIHADVPNVKLEDIHIEADKHSVTIRGETEIGRQVQDATWYRRERECGSFSRTLTLPNIDPNKIVAKKVEGTLEIRVPKGKSSLKKRIVVQS